MQKKFNNLGFHKESLIENLLRMKRMTLFVLVIICTVSPFGYSRATTENLNFENVLMGVNFNVTEKSTDIYNQQLQKKSVKGIVSDETGIPMPGVTVQIEGTTIGTITDIYGQYSIEIPNENVILIFSFIGFNTSKVPYTGLTTLNIKLSTAVKSLEEVVVVGYGVQKKQSVVGAISVVDNASLVKSGNTNITNAIAGKLSGVLTIQNTGEPGNNNAEIIVRGLSSWNGSAPLVLVDGVERDFSNLDPNEVNTISVLKDASATAVFGAKGANGVLIITTKRGTLSKPVLNFSASYGLVQPTRLPEHIDSYTTMSMLNVAYMNNNQYSSMSTPGILNQYRNPSTRLNALQYPDVNWFDILTQPFAPLTNANLNISGGTKFVKYFSSLGFQSEGNYFKGLNEGYLDSRFKNQKFNYRANVDFSLSHSTQLSFNLGGDLSIKNTPYQSDGATWEALYMTGGTRFPAYYPDWVLKEVPDLDDPTATGWRRVTPFGERFGDPYTNFMQGAFRSYTGSRVFTDVILDQKLDGILQGLSFKGKVSTSSYYNMQTLYSDYYYPTYKLYYDRIGVDANHDGVIDQNPWERINQTNEVYALPPQYVQVGGLSSFYTDLYYEMSLNYANTFGKHTVSGLVLMNRQQKNSGTDFPYYNEALVGRGTYNYSHKYLFEVNLGYTGSERFAPGNRFGFFPSGAIGWIISEEPFFKKALPWMNKLKVRYSDGLVGSDYAANRWLYISEYYTSGSTILEDKAANKNAQWEQARKRDLGIEISAFKNFSLSVDLFDEQRTKMLLSPQTVTFLVGNSFKELNLGSLKKHGIEIEAEYNKTVSRNLNYYIKGNFGFNENRIIYKDDPIYTPDYLKVAGTPLGGQMSGVKLVGSGFITSVDDMHTYALPAPITSLNVGDYAYLDFNADGKISNSDKYAIKGSDYPPVTYSFSSGFSYKGFEFNFMLQGNSGKYVVYNDNFEYEFLLGDYSVHAAQKDYWRPDNQNVNHATLHYTTAAGGLPQYSWGGGAQLEGYNIRVENKSWRNADYLRLKDVYAGYTFKSEFLKRISGVSSLQVYTTANNLLTFTNLLEGDPERKDFQRGFYPLMVTYKLGIKLSF